MDNKCPGTMSNSDKTAQNTVAPGNVEIINIRSRLSLKNHPEWIGENRIKPSPPYNLIMY